MYKAEMANAPSSTTDNPSAEKLEQLVCGTSVNEDSEEEDSSSMANFLSVGLMILCSLLKM